MRQTFIKTANTVNVTGLTIMIYCLWCSLNIFNCGYLNTVTYLQNRHFSNCQIVLLHLLLDNFDLLTVEHKDMTAGTLDKEYQDM